MKIKMKDYERIYKTINAVILNEGADPTGACTFFAFYGSHILNQHYNMKSQAVGGSCWYHLGGEGDVLGFGNGNTLQEGFHCWVIADGWLIDFMAPVFPELLKKGKADFSCQPKMIQKPISGMAASHLEMKSEGDFYFEVNPAITNERVQYLSKKGYSDLQEICSKWYRKPPRNMRKKINIADAKGNQNTAVLSGRSVVGSW